MYDFYKKCEESLKKRILNDYGNYLSDKQRKMFKNKDYITDEVMGIKKLNEVFDYLTNNMLNDLINVTCSKSSQINEDTEISIPCGNTLKTALVNFYKRAIANTINFKPTINYAYAYDMDLLNFANSECDKVLDKNVFSKNALELSEIDVLSSYINDTISIDIENFVKKP